MPEYTSYKGFDIKIEACLYPLNPRTDWDHGTTILSTRPVQIKCESDYQPGTDDLLELKKGLMFDNVPIYAILPLYYINNGYGCHRLSTEHDFGQLGWIYMTQENFHELYFSTEEEFESHHPDKTIAEYCREVMRAQVESYEQYLNSEIYYFEVLDDNGDVLDNCSGFFGDDHRKSGLFDEAEGFIDRYIKHNLERRSEILKGYIKNKVDLIYRELPSINGLNLFNG
jgi:hypothetical protein